MKEKKGKVRLTKYERDLRDSVERSEWRSRPKEETAKTVAAVKSFLEAQRKEARVNLRLNTSVVDAIKVLAAEEGIPYQTLIGSVLHKYVSGKLVDRNIVEELKSALRDSEKEAS